MLACPECGGPLWKNDGGESAHYRCRVGHAYTIRSLLSAGDEAIEASIWVRMFDQRANVLSTLASKDRAANRGRMLERHEELAKEARAHAKALRNLLMSEKDETTVGPA